MLREIAQTPDEDLDAFQDIARHRYFNTNTLWVDLARAAPPCSRARDGVLGLPMIVNRKTVDPSDPASPAVVPARDGDGRRDRGLRGRARAARAAARASRRSRRPNDLLALRSDAYVLTDDCRVELAPRARRQPPVVDLDPELLQAASTTSSARFPAGPPSLVECER